MLVSTKGRYALRALVDMAEHSDEGLVSLRDISIRQDISLKYMESIARELVNAGLIEGFRGKSGGYKLSRSPEAITVLEVLDVTEGTVSPVNCVDSCSPDCQRKDDCRSLPMWNELNGLLEDYFKDKSIKDLMRK
ncbi:MAG: RrF2 family transcriptional regulator [Sphaerochaetaceae bacterium]|nr:RrF2 family transcriptional regulator [Sphaerochaetaceae bacterium]